MTPSAEDSFASVRDMATELGATLVDQPQAFEIHFARPPLRLHVTVASEVLEWFLDVDDDASGLRYRDWCDYTGYDKRPHDELAADMAGHLRAILPVLAAGEFRIVPDTVSWFCPLDRLEWRLRGEWADWSDAECW
jgi:hypothetical protein